MDKKFRKYFNINSKLALIYALVVVASVLVAVLSLYSTHHNLTEDRKSKVKDLVETTWSLVKYYHEKSETELSQEEAQYLALDAIRSIRYSNQEYFWVNDLEARVLMHPIKPYLEGEIQADYADGFGQFMFKDFTEVAKLHGEGFVQYHWPRPNEIQPIGKISFVKLFEPWGWVIGSGIYVDDINHIFYSTLRYHLVTLILLLTIIGALVWSILRYDATSLSRHRLMATALEACADAILISDRKGNIIWCNSAFERLSGYSVAEIIGKNPRQIIKSGKQDVAFYRNMWLLLSRGESWSGELLNKTKDHHIYHEEMTITPVLNEDRHAIGFIAVKRDISQQKEKQSHLEELASKDSLTDLLNRRSFTYQFKKHLKKVNSGSKGVLLMLDLDKFKRVNDEHGHLIGDRVLKQFASVLKDSLRQDDIVGRLGGEEFAILMPVAGIEHGQEVFERIRSRLHQEKIYYAEDKFFNITVSMGLTLITSEDTHPEPVIDRADKALYRAKNNGRDRMEIN